MLIHEAARVALYSHRLKADALPRERRAAQQARALSARATQLVGWLHKQIDRLPAPNYPGGPELLDARAKAHADLEQWRVRHLHALQQYESGLAFAPSLLPQSQNGRPRVPWLAIAAEAARQRVRISGRTPARATREVAERLIERWRALGATPAELRSLLLAPKAQIDGVSAETLASEYLTERISKALDRLPQK